MPLPLVNTRFLGAIGNLLEVFVKNRIQSEYARNVVYREAEDAFKNKLDDESGVIGIWQGEFWGKWIISAVRVCEYTGNEDEREFIRKSVHSLLKYQEPNGYLGTYRDPLFVFPADREKAKAIVGFSCNWNWNIWCRKYTLWGLLEAYRLLKEPQILEGAVKLADHLMASLSEAGICINDTGTFNGLPSGSIIKPLCVLYQETKEEKYLDYAVRIAERWDDPTGKMPNLIANARSGRPLHEWYPESQTWAKAYEMMSCLDGLLELYRMTGTRKYFDTAAAMQKLLLAHERNLVESVGYNDIFAHASAQLNTISEPCDVVHWLRLNYELFLLTGDIQYIDTCELAFLNAFLAGSFREGTWGGRGVRSHGRHYWVTEQAKCKHNHCCVNNLPRGYMNMAQAAVMKRVDSTEIAVNFYTPFRAKTGDVELEIGGSYLRNGQVQVTVRNHGVNTVPLSFRIPSWSRKSTVNGRPAAAGIYKTCAAGETTTIFTLQFDFTPQLVDFPCTVPQYDDKDWHVQRWSNLGTACSAVPAERFIRTPHATLHVGPLVLAKSKQVGDSEQDIFDTRSFYGRNATCALEPMDCGPVMSAFQLTVKGEDGSIYATKVSDYATAANRMTEDNAFFSIFF